MKKYIMIAMLSIAVLSVDSAYGFFGQGQFGGTGAGYTYNCVGDWSCGAGSVDVGQSPSVSLDDEMADIESGANRSGGSSNHNTAMVIGSIAGTMAFVAVAYYVFGIDRSENNPGHVRIAQF